MTESDLPRGMPPQAQALVESGRNSLFTARLVLETSKETYGKTTDFLGEQQSKLAEIQSTLTKLTNDKIEMVRLFHEFSSDHS